VLEVHEEAPVPQAEQVTPEVKYPEVEQVETQAVVKLWQTTQIPLLMTYPVEQVKLTGAEHPEVPGKHWIQVVINKTYPVLHDRATELEEQEAALDGQEIQALDINEYPALQLVETVEEVHYEVPDEQATQALEDKK